MTVKHLRDLQRRQLHSAAATDTSVAGKYRAGFTECASEVTRYLGTVDGLKPDVRDRLMLHLNGCVHRVHSPVPEHLQAQAQTLPAVATSSAQVHYVQQQQSTATSAMNVLPVASMASTTGVPATRPIQIQIPVATSPTSLPGAGVQALQLAASVPTAAPQHQQRTPSAQHTSATYSPVSAPAYIGAFQVIPSGQAAFMLPQGVGGQQIGLVNQSGAIYATVNTSPVQQAQLQQMILSQAHLMATTQQQHTTTATTSPVAPSSVCGKRRAEGNHHTDSSQAVKKMMTRCDPVCGVKAGVKVEIQDEKVWRPW